MKNRDDHAAMVRRAEQFKEEILNRSYRRPPSGIQPLTHVEATRVEMVSTTRRNHCVVPPVCIEAWGKTCHCGNVLTFESMAESERLNTKPKCGECLAVMLDFERDAPVENKWRVHRMIRAIKRELRIGV